MVSEMSLFLFALAIVVAFRLGRLRELERSLERRFETENEAFLERLRCTTT
jgi:hypothetical protein